MTHDTAVSVCDSVTERNGRSHDSSAIHRGHHGMTHRPTDADPPHGLHLLNLSVPIQTSLSLENLDLDTSLPEASKSQGNFQPKVSFSGFVARQVLQSAAGSFAVPRAFVPWLTHLCLRTTIRTRSRADARGYSRFPSSHSRRNLAAAPEAGIL